MVADCAFTGKEDQTAKHEDLSATIIVVGRVEYKMGLVHLSGRTIFDCRLAIREFYQRTKIIKHYRADGAITRRMAGKVILIATSFDRRKRERAEAITKISDHFAGFKDIPASQVVKAIEGVAEQEMKTVREVAEAIQGGQFPKNVIIAGDEPSFCWFDPLERILKKHGVIPQYLRECRFPLPAYT